MVSPCPAPDAWWKVTVDPDELMWTLSSASNVTVFLNANVLEIETDGEAREVTSLRVGTFNRKEIRVASKAFVLACGGLEVPRLLLASNRVVACGLGNRHDLVGRFFMDHPYFFMGYYEPSRPEYDRSVYVIEDYDLAGTEQKFHASFTLGEALRRREGLNGASIYFVRRPGFKSLPAYFSRGGGNPSVISWRYCVTRSCRTGDWADICGTP